MKKYKPNWTRIQNKLFALLFLTLGLLTANFTEGGWIFLLPMTILATYTFFSKDKILGG